MPYELNHSMKIIRNYSQNDADWLDHEHNILIQQYLNQKPDNR